MGGGLAGLDAAALVHRHIHDHGAGLHELQVVAPHQLRSLGAREQHGADHDVGLAELVEQIVTVGVQQIDVGGQHVGEVAQPIEREVEQRHVRAQARRHLGRVGADHPPAQDEHLGGEHPGHASQQDARPAVHLFQVLGTLLHRHASRHLTHRREQRQLSRGELHGLIGDRGDPRPEHRLREGLGRRKMEIGEHDLPFPHTRPLGLDRLLDLDHHFGLGPHVPGPRDQRRAGRPVGVV